MSYLNVKAARLVRVLCTCKRQVEIKEFVEFAEFIFRVFIFREWIWVIDASLVPRLLLKNFPSHNLHLLLT